MRRQREDDGIARRENAVLLLDDGKSCAQIAKFLYMDDVTIRGWYKFYQQDGWDTLPSMAGRWSVSHTQTHHAALCA